MKSQSEIEKRLRSLRVKYAKRYVAKSQSRCHQNCTYNREHVPRGTYPASKSLDVEMTPHKQVTLMVVQPDEPIRLCMYGSEDPANWMGNICDNDDISRSCKMFKPRTSLQEARGEFMEKLQDDEFVFDNYRDMAAFQWVLSTRLHKMPLSWWENLILWFQVILHIRARRSSRLPEPELTDELWKEDAPPPPTP